MTVQPIKMVPGIVPSFLICIVVALSMGVLIWGIGVRIGLVAW
jgi:hypothetical protein